MGFSLHPSPPMAERKYAGKFGGFLQLVVDDSRSTASQVLLKFPVISPPQISNLEKPLNK
jgi:hypothetical protein